MAAETLNFTGDRKVSVRTMKSDISAFLKETKPSLVQLISTQTTAERLSEPSERQARRRLEILAIIAISLVFLAAIGFLAWQKLVPGGSEKNHTAVIPQPFFSVEKFAAIDYRPETRNLKEKIREAALATEKTGVMKRIVAIYSTPTSVATLDGNDFLKEADVAVPRDAAPSLTGPVMLIAHKAGAGTRLATVIKTGDARRVFEILIRNERDALLIWRGLFLNTPAAPKNITFEDRDYRNINYRILTIDEAGDLRVIYGIFPAKEYIIAASSRETFQEIVNRLYEDN